VGQLGHTPGPWRAEKDDIGWFVWTPGSNFYQRSLPVWGAPARREEDARLVASAPELLGACVYALNVLQTQAAPGPAEQRAIEELRAVIAKARGQEVTR